MRYFQKLKSTLTAFGLLALLVVPTTTVLAQTDPFDKSCEISGASSSKLCQQKDEEINNVNSGGGILGNNSVILTIIRTLILVIGAISVVVIIIGGLRYVLSNGDANGVQAAKNTILYAVVGLIVAVSGQVIIGFVLARLN